MKHTQRTTKLCSVLFASIALFALVAGPAAAAEKSTPAKKSASGFSFAVYGDSRSMMYLPYMETQKEEATNAMVDREANCRMNRRRTRLLFPNSDQPLREFGIVVHRSRNEIFGYRYNRSQIRRYSSGNSAAFCNPIDICKHALAHIRFISAHCKLHLHFIRDDVVFGSSVD